MGASSVDIKDIFESSSVSLGTFATDIFIGHMPDSPDACVTIYDTGGTNPQSGYEYHYPTVNIKVRGAVWDYTGAYSKAYSVYESLHDVTNETWNSTKYHGIWAMSDPFFLEYDEKMRPLFTINFITHRS